MKLFKGIICLTVCSVFGVLSSLAQADFKLYSDEKEPFYEMGVTSHPSEKGLKVFVGAEGTTLNDALCNGFSELSEHLRTDIVRTEVESGGSIVIKNNLNIAGLKISSESILSGKSLSETITITDGQVSTSCNFASEDKPNGESIVSYSFEYNLTNDYELDLRQDFEDEKCSYRLLEHGYFPDDNYFAVLIGFTCK